MSPKHKALWSAWRENPSLTWTNTAFRKRRWSTMSPTLMCKTTACLWNCANKQKKRTLKHWTTLSKWVYEPTGKAYKYETTNLGTMQMQNLHNQGLFLCLE